jgi:hypothetical protein
MHNAGGKPSTYAKGMRPANSTKKTSLFKPPELTGGNTSATAKKQQNKKTRQRATKSSRVGGSCGCALASAETSPLPAKRV